jgi:hypothetical protein
MITPMKNIMMGCLKWTIPFNIGTILMNIIDCCSLGADSNQLSSIAVNRLQRELAKDGRDPAAASSFKVPQKAPAGAAGRSAFSKSLGKKKGQNLAVSSAYTHVCWTM